MMKINRNDKCPCGSGKKYKKCCLDNSKTTSLSTSSYDKKEALKMLGLLQLVPENHGKNLRIEKAIAHLMTGLKKNIKEGKRSGSNNIFEPDGFMSSLNKEFPKMRSEDPPESSFVENIMFINGNNRVFPGVLEGGVQVVQNLLDCIFSFDNELPDAFKQVVHDGVLFILTIHDQLASNLGFRRYDFSEQIMIDLHFTPNVASFRRNLLEFDPHEIAEVCSTLEIEDDIINEFTIEPVDFNYNKNDPNSNPLLFKPFVKIDGTYILAAPSAEIVVINEFILKKAHLFKCHDLLQALYKKVNFSICLKELDNMGMSLTDIGISESNDVYTPPYTCVLNFDTDKFAIVSLLDTLDHSQIQFSKSSIKKFALKIKEIEPQGKIHLIGVPIRLSAMSALMISYKPIKNIDLTTVLNPFELMGINTLWETDRLTLWQYARHMERADEKIFLAPGFNTLTYFNWYQRNGESFFHSDEAYDTIMFDFHTQANLIRQVNETLDIHSSLTIVNDNRIASVKVQKREPELPLYDPIIQPSDRNLTLLEKYEMPIWVTTKQHHNMLAEGFSGAITYWLNEMYPTLSKRISTKHNYPITIDLDFDSRYFGSNEKTFPDENKLDYSVDSKTRIIEIHIPLSFSDLISNKNNQAERALLGCTLKGMIELLNSWENKNYFDNDSEIRTYVNHILADKAQRMLIPLRSDDRVRLNPSNIIRPRYIQESEISYIRENLVEWAEITTFPQLVSKKEKTHFCNQIVSVLIKKYSEFVSQFNFKSLLRVVMITHESLVFNSSYAEASLSPRLVCFAQYQNVRKEYKKKVLKSVPSLLSYRSLVEFIVADPPNGELDASSTDIDYLAALVEQIISFGNLSDTINEGFSDTVIDLLPSGRIGIDHDFFENEFADFRNSLLGSRIDNIITEKEQSENGPEETEKEMNFIDQEFAKDWGIGLYQISEICTFLSYYAIFELESSFVIKTQRELKELFNKTPFSQAQISSFLDLMTMKSRGHVGNPPNGQRREDIYPWRYNRRLSYLRLPIIVVKHDDGTVSYAWSPRHLETASENLLALFDSGALKIDPKHKHIATLLAKRNNINGKKFRKKVFYWLSANSSFDIVPHEVKIGTNAILKNKENLGDIDILAIDNEGKRILLLEIKNTKQAKIVFEFKRDIESYLKNLIPKHQKRVLWIDKNRDKLSNVINYSVIDYAIFSCIISSSTLPVKYLDKSPMKIFSLSELKSEGVSILR